MASVVSRVYDDMRNRILGGEFGANELFVEQRIAEEYQVSRGTAREALQLLCNAKFLIKHPRKGYFIYNFSDDEIQDVLQARYFLEIGAASLVIRKCTDAQIETLYAKLNGSEKSALPENTVNSGFHLALAKLSGNKMIPDLLAGLLDITARKFLHVSSSEGKALHEEIVKALLARDVEQCGEALKKDMHLQ